MAPPADEYVEDDRLIDAIVDRTAGLGEHLRELRDCMRALAFHNQGALRDTTQMSILLLGHIVEQLASRQQPKLAESPSEQNDPQVELDRELATLARLQAMAVTPGWGMHRTYLVRCLMLLGRITESLARRLDAHGIPKA